MEIKEISFYNSSVECSSDKDFVFYVLNKFYYDYFRATFNSKRLYPRKFHNSKNEDDFDISLVVKEIFKFLKSKGIVNAKSYKVYRIGRLFTDFLCWCFFKLDIFNKFSTEEKIRFIVKSTVILNEIVFRYVTAKQIEFVPNNPVMSYPKYWFIINLRFIRIYINRFRDELARVDSIKLKDIMKNEILFQDKELEKFNNIMNYLVDYYYVDQELNAWENINNWFNVIFTNMNIFNIETFIKLKR